MQILKGMALGLVGFFLLLGLMLLGLVWTVNNTALNPEFTVNEAGKLEISAVASEALKKEISEEDSAYISAVDKTLAEIKPWIDAQIKTVTYAGYDYILGQTDKLFITLPTAEIRPYIVDNFAEAYLKDPPQSYLQVPVSERPRVLEDFKQTIGDIIPSSINIDADFIGTDGMQTLDQVRDITGYLRTSYFALIGICVLLILLTVLILREMKGIFRCAGIIFTIVGVLTTIVSLVIKNLAPNFIPENDLPAAVQTWIPQLIGDLLSPWTIYGIILLVAGVILLGLSLLVRRNRQEAESPVNQ